MIVSGVAEGDTGNVTIAAVDVGILNLTGFQSPDPSGHYFGQRRLGMDIRDVYGRLIDGQAGPLGRVRSGGDAGAQMRMQAPPPAEANMVFFSGMVETDAAGVAAEVHTRMPVILAPDDYAVWTGGKPDEARSLCRPWEGDLAIDRTDQPWSGGASQASLL